MKRSVIAFLCFALGFVLCSYPLVSSIAERRVQRKAVATHQNAVDSRSREEIEKALSDAEAYNDMLWQTTGVIIGNIAQGILSTESYENMLNVSGNGIMGTVKIPKIQVNLPIYHGTEEEVLKNGIGHIPESSLPAGGENTHCILTGHRGLPSSKLFTRLDEMKEGDLFFVETCGRKAAYQVSEITVVRPDDVEGLGIREGQDMVSLVTCTPYGLNTHRLIVTGHRVAYQEDSEDALKWYMPSFRELFFSSMPFCILGIAAGKVFRGVKRKKKGEVQ